MESDESEAIARVRGSGARRKAGKRPEDPKTNWFGIREEYVTGTETTAQMARRLGINCRTIEEHAGDRRDSGKTWAELRADFQEDVARTFRMESAQKQVEAQHSVHDGQVKAVQQLADIALPLALEQLANRTVGGYDAVKAIVSILGAQRRIHGLDKAMRVEVTGKDGEPLQHDVKHDAKLTDEQRLLATSALQALFGEPAESA